jgi:sec-independent protein translocase protein TatA
MGGFSIVHWLIVLVVVLLLFGRGRISEIMGDFGKGIKSFKQGIADEDTKPAAPPAQISAPSAEPTATASVETAAGKTEPK